MLDDSPKLAGSSPKVKGAIFGGTEGRRERMVKRLVLLNGGLWGWLHYELLDI